MKLAICIAVLCMFVASGFARQNDPQSQSGQPGQRRTGQPGSNQSGTTAAPDQTGRNSGTSTPEMKTQSYKGTLVDASCGQSSTATGQTGTEHSNSAERSTADASGTSGNSGQSKSSTSADRASSGASCPVTSSTSQFALKMTDGRTLRFDLVGNQRAQEELKNNKKWSKESADGKEIHAKVSGVVSGDKLVVSSIH